jgi:macrolide transport system ATP-binding/permease protein
MARALAGQPEVVLADEPTSNLDREAGRALLAAIQEMHAEGRTVVLSSHDPRVLALATHVHELEGGRLAPPRRAEDTIQSLAKDPAPDHNPG